MRRTDTSPIFLGEAVKSWAVAHHCTGRREHVVSTTPQPRPATVTLLLKPGSSQIEAAHHSLVPHTFSCSTLPSLPALSF